MHIKNKDKVVVITGKDKGKIGDVLKSFPIKNKVIVAKVNIIKKSVKPTQDSKGGIIEIENPLNASNVMLICSKCNKPTRIKKDILSDGKKVRVCKKCGEIII